MYIHGFLLYSSFFQKKIEGDRPLEEELPPRSQASQEGSTLDYVN
jgi:hypothetical protein